VNNLTSYPNLGKSLFTEKPICTRLGTTPFEAASRASPGWDVNPETAIFRAVPLRSAHRCGAPPHPLSSDVTVKGSVLWGGSDISIASIPPVSLTNPMGSYYSVTDFFISESYDCDRG
jgi:hypothetical protein